MGSVFRKGSEQSGQSQALSGQQAQMANQMFGSAKPMIDRLFGMNTEMLRGDGLPAGLRSTVGLGVPIAQQEAELATAKRGIMDSMPRGGLQQRALMELPLQRLLQRDMLSANRNAIDDSTRQNLFSTAMSAATGMPQQAMGGIGSAAGNLNSLGQQRIGQNQQALQGTGQLIGQLGKGAMMMCWIAERFYGKDDARTHILRAWFRSQPDWWVTKLYQRHGEWASRQWWCGALRPLFTYWLGRATQWAHSAAV
jgi:hypothetical protein